MTWGTWFNWAYIALGLLLLVLGLRALVVPNARREHFSVWASLFIGAGVLGEGGLRLIGQSGSWMDAVAHVVFLIGLVFSIRSSLAARQRYLTRSSASQDQAKD